LKVMGTGLKGGASFMEDYTYHLDPRGPKVLGAHMLEICPSLAGDRPTCEIHPLGIGGKSDPVRLTFTSPAGPALNVAMIDLGDRFRLVANEVDGVAPDQPLPNLPVARVLWTPRPNLKTAATAWIYAGGPHHMVLSQALTSEHIEDFAEMVGVECVRIDAETRIGEIRNQLRWNEAFFGNRP
jgi:L-arabinose isomerase